MCFGLLDKTSDFNTSSLALHLFSKQFYGKTTMHNVWICIHCIELEGFWILLTSIPRQEMYLDAHRWFCFFFQRNWPKPKRRIWTCTRCWTKPFWSSTIYRNLFRAMWGTTKSIEQYNNRFNLPPKAPSIRPCRWNLNETSTVNVRIGVNLWSPWSDISKKSVYFKLKLFCVL